MSIEVLTRNISLLFNSLNFNANHLKSNDDYLIFGYMFGFYSKEIQEYLNFNQIDGIKREFQVLNDKLVFLHLSDKISFINSEITKIINSQSKQMNIIPQNQYFYDINSIEEPNIPKNNLNSFMNMNNIGKNNHETKNRNVINPRFDSDLYYNNRATIKNNLNNDYSYGNQSNYLNYNNSIRNIDPNFSNLNIHQQKKPINNYDIIDINQINFPLKTIDNHSNIYNRKVNRINFPKEDYFNDFEILHDDNNIKNNEAIKYEEKKEQFNFQSKNEVKNEQYLENYNYNIEDIVDGECQICTEKFNYLDQENAFLDCNCIIHGVCFSSFIENEITDNNLPINCPNQSCRREINAAIILKVIKSNDNLFKKYEKFTLGFYQKTKEDIFSCPTPDCDYVFFNDQEQNRFDCPKCKNSYCLKCNAIFHTNMTCIEYKSLNSMKEEEKEFFNLAQNNKFKQCPKCKMFVEKNQGCDHMTCLCKHEFCYICGKSYINKFPDCTCIKNNCIIF